MYRALEEMTVQKIGNETLEKRLNDLIFEMECHKKIKDLANDYHVVLREMKNLRDGIEIGF